MEAWQAVALVLAALVIGALLPAAVQLTLTLRALRASVARGDQALEAVTAAARRLDWLGATLEEGGRVERFLEGVDGLAALAGRVQDGARLATAIGVALGPALGAAVRAWKASSVDGGAASSGANGAAVNPTWKEEDQ